MASRPHRENLGKLWTCPRCARKFANTNQQHACGRWTVAGHFKGKPPALRGLFDRFVALIRTCGPMRVHATKTRVGFITRMTFAAATPGRDRLRCHLILSRKVERPRFTKIEMYSPRCYGHYFDVRCEADLDEELQELIGEAYRVGMQAHLRMRG